MLTYNLTEGGGSLYEKLYHAIREDILHGRLRAGEKLPSKRALADHLKISKVTVETAYAQLCAEGYLHSREKVGYFVESVSEAPPRPTWENTSQKEQAELPGFEADLTSNRLMAEAFPFSVWAKISRQVILDHGAELLAPMPNTGALTLRQAIADHLYGFRSMKVSPDQILVGAGTDFLYNVLIQLLGRDKCYAVEDPGYHKIWKVYEAAGVPCKAVPLDEEGVCPDALGNADVLHISPSHHFPTGVVTPIGRRQALLAWAEQQEGRYLIEDDYDSEFRLSGRPIPTLQSFDRSGKVIYMNSFTKSLAPSIRISFLVLPVELMERFREKLGFYACTVPSFEQYTLAEFLCSGHFEKHLNRMKKYYRGQRDLLLEALRDSAFGEILEISNQDAGLHFLLKVKTSRTDRELKALCAASGIKVQCLSDFFMSGNHADTHTIVANYSGFDCTKAKDLLKRLEVNRT